jgi:hypothetical protein
MQYIITCPSCQQQLTVNPGWEGQQVNCPLCSAPFVMPSPPPVAVAVPVSMPVVERIEPAPKPILWNPTAAANWSLFFGPVFGTALHYVNWVTLGESKKAEQASKWFMVSVCVLIFGTVAMTQASDSTLILSINIALLLGWYFISAREQIRYVKQQHGKDYGRRRWWKPLLGSFAILLIVTELTGFRPNLSPQILELAQSGTSPFRSGDLKASRYEYSQKICGESIEALKTRYGKPTKELPAPGEPNRMVLSFNVGDRRIVVSSLGGNVVLVAITSPEDVSEAERDAFLAANAMGSRFVPLPSEIGLKWKREDHKAFASYEKKSDGYELFIFPVDERKNPTNTEQSDLLSVKDWLDKAKSVIGEELANQLGTNQVIVEEGDAFLKAVGEPKVVGQKGKHLLFSWRCRDGVIIVAVNALFWQSQKVLIIDEFSFVNR